MTEVHGPSQARANVRDLRPKPRVVGNILESNDQAIVIAVRLLETEFLYTEIVESFKILNGTVT